MNYPKGLKFGVGDISRRRAQEFRAKHLPARTLEERLGDVAIAQNYKRLRDLSPFAAAKYGQQNAGAIESAYLILDQMREASAAPVELTDVHAALTAMLPKEGAAQ